MEITFIWAVGCAWLAFIVGLCVGVCFGRAITIKEIEGG